jgi:hypothetical protein
MKFVTRAELGWPASAAPDQLTTDGVKVHYLGSPFTAKSHADCVAQVKAVRKSHLANKAENYSDIAYNLIVCRHGYVFEGRGKRKRTGANGNQTLNKAHYAVLALLGSSGDTSPTPEMIEGIKDAIAYLRTYGAGKQIKGHRDGYATACPGDALYGLVRAGKLEPGTSAPAKPAPKPKPVYAPFPGTSFFRLGKKHPLITEMGKALVRAGYKGYAVGPGSEFTRADIKAYAWWQRKLGYTGSAADGYPGKASWDKLKVSQPKK